MPISNPWKSGAWLVLKAITQACANLARAIKRGQKIRALARELDLVEELL